MAECICHLQIFCALLMRKSRIENTPKNVQWSLICSFRNSSLWHDFLISWIQWHHRQTCLSWMLFSLRTWNGNFTPPYSVYEAERQEKKLQDHFFRWVLTITEWKGISSISFNNFLVTFEKKRNHYPQSRWCNFHYDPHLLFCLISGCKPHFIRQS